MSLKFLHIYLIGLLLVSQMVVSEGESAEGEAPGPEGGDSGNTPAEANAEGGDSPAEGGDANAAAAPKKKLIKCKRHLLETFKLEGKEFGEEMTLDMCPDVETSCCTVKDQLTIFDAWVREEEGKKLTDRLDYHFTVYSELILELEKALPIATTLGSKHKTPGVIKNCKLLANRVSEFNIAMIGPKIKESVRAMHTFLHDSYKGVYCTLCNANNHKFFHTEKKTVDIGLPFCRKVIANSLHTSIYYHVHLKKLMNLVSVMLTSCDKDANFMHGISVPVELNFVVDDIDERELEDCVNNVESPKWWAYCGRFCEEFNLSMYSEFFQPDLAKYKKMTKYLRTKFDKFLEPEKQTPESPDKEAAPAKEGEKKAEPEKSSNERILSRKIYRDRYLEDEKKEEEKKEEEKKEEEKKEEEKKEEGSKKSEDADEKEGGGEGADAEEKKKDKDEESVKVDPNDLKPTNIMDLSSLFEDLAVIRRTINGVSPLERYESFCANEGIDPHETGMKALINDATHASVKQLIAEMSKKAPPPEKKPEPEAGFFARMMKSLFG